MLHNVKPLEPSTYQYRFYDWLRNNVRCKSAHNLCDAVDRIMKKSNFILNRIPEGVPLVIIMGEYHSMPAHKALQQAILAAHLKQRDIAPNHTFSVGMEIAHNTYKKTPNAHSIRDSLRRWSGITIPEDYTGQKNVRALLDYSSWDELDFSKQAVTRFCRQHDISVSFNDLAKYSTKDGAYYLDRWSDPYTDQLLRQYAPSKFPTITLNSCSSDGMAIRNIGIVDRAIQHIERTRSRIYIQQCGQAHTFGKRHRYSYEHSLANLFHTQGVAVLPVFIDVDGKETDTIPEEADKSNSIIVKNLSKRQTFKDKEDETAFWAKINSASDGILDYSGP